jgi:hypothetical protein
MDQIYENHPLLILESRLDWLSATVKPGQRQKIIAGKVAAWIDQRVAAGFDRRGFQTPFYKGVRTDGIAWGERTDDASITLSGEMASRYGPMVITWADTISRCDVQVTLLEPNLTRNWAGYVDRIAGLDERVKNKQTSTRLYTKRPDGITSYIGDGASDRMLRVYDKYAESEHHYPCGSWRWEVQYRHQRAAVVAQRLLDNHTLPGACLAAVCKAFLDYRIDVPALCIPQGWKDAGISQETDNDRRLAWLRRSVAPAVDKLMGAYGLETVLDALGLTAVVDTLEGQKAAMDYLDGTRSANALRLAAALSLDGEHLQ